MCLKRIVTAAITDLRGQTASISFALPKFICRIGSSVFVLLYLHFAILSWLRAPRRCCHFAVLLTASTLMMTISLHLDFLGIFIFHLLLCLYFLAPWMSQKHGGILLQHDLWRIVRGLYCLSELTVGWLSTPDLSNVPICFSNFLLHGVQIAYFLGVI